MPVIKLIDPANGLRQPDVWVIQAHMRHPGNPRHRDEYIATKVAEHITGTVENASGPHSTEEIDPRVGVMSLNPSGEPMPDWALTLYNQHVIARDLNCECALGLPPRMLEALMRAPGTEEVQRRADEADERGGAIAGDILLDVLRQAEDDPKTASIGKAKHRLVKDLKRLKYNERNQRVVASNRAIDDRWAEFKSVAHFWAAVRLWQALNKPSDFSPQTFESMPLFLGMAEHMRARAEKLLPHGQVKPILDPFQTWRLPPELAVEIVEELPLRQIFEFAPDSLADYKARRR